MPVHIKNKPLKYGYVGSNKLHKMYKGSTLIWSSASVITYNVDTGLSYSEEIDEGESVLSPSTFTPTKSGWTFLGWREDNTPSSSVLVNKVATGDPMTLYAVFRQSVTLYTYNGSTTRTSTSGYRYHNNDAADVNPSFTLSEAALTGWTKLGWTTSDSSYSATVADGSSVTLSSNATYYSLYRTTITCTYYNGSTSASSQSGYKYRNYHSSTSDSNPSFTLVERGTIDNYWQPIGWSTSSTSHSTAGGTTYTVTLSSDTTFYAVFSHSQTTTVYYWNTQSDKQQYSSTRYKIFGSSEVVHEADVKLTLNTVTGWTKVGWTSERSGSNYYIDNITIHPTGDETFYAWYQQTIYVTYYNNSSSASSSSGIRRLICYPGDSPLDPTFTLTQSPVSGWTARGWSTSSSASGTIAYSNGATFSRSSDITLYGSYYKTITYTLVGGVSSTLTGTAYRGYDGSASYPTFTLNQEAVSTWSAIGWSYSYDPKSTRVYSNGQSVQATSDATLYGSWLKTIILTYDGAGGTTSQGASSVSQNGTSYLTPDKIQMPAAFILGSNPFANQPAGRGGFLNWITSNGVRYNPGANIELYSNTTIYAEWTSVTPVDIANFTEYNWTFGKLDTVPADGHSEYIINGDLRLSINKTGSGWGRTWYEATLPSGYCTKCKIHCSWIGDWPVACVEVNGVSTSATKDFQQPLELTIPATATATVRLACQTSDVYATYDPPYQIMYYLIQFYV